MLIRIDPTRETPVFLQIAASVRAQIVAGRLAQGDKLPSAREVAASLDINVHTVLHAYQGLRDEGLVELRRGRGATVTGAAQALVQLRSEIDQLVDAAAKLGVGREALASLVRDAPA
ncbi:MAG: GntR family transcriptional regulator [Galactobacter sp.]